MADPVTRPPRDELVRAVYPGVRLIPAASAAASTDPAAAGEARAVTVTGGMPVIEGHFSVFNVWTEIDSYWEGNFLERIAPGAFTKTLRENLATIRMCFQHGMDPQIGDKPIAPIDEAGQDDIGGFYRGELLDTLYVRELIPGLERGLYGSSFRFRVMKEDWVQYPETSDSNPRGLPERTIREAQVFEFGPVVFPQYPEADAGLRSADPAAPLVRSLTDRYIVGRVLGLAMSDVDPTRLREEIEAIRSRATALPSQEPASATPPPDESRSSAPATVTTEPPAEPPPADSPPAAPATSTTTEARSKTGPSDSRSGKKGSRSMPPQATTTTYDFSALDEYRSVEEMNTAIGEREARQREIDAEHTGNGLGGDEAEWQRNIAEIAELERRRTAVEERQAWLDARSQNDGNVGSGDGGQPTRYSAPNVNRALNDAEIHDVAAIRARTRGDEEFVGQLRDHAKRSIERARFAHDTLRGSASQDRIRSHLVELVDELDADDNPTAGAFSRHILMTGHPLYRKAFGNYIAQQALTTGEQNILAETKRALSVGTGSGGGFAVVYTLDPTIVPTSNFSVNPWRALARIETIAGTNEWKAVTSGAITAAYSAEATEASDNAPTLAQPDIIVEKAQAYVPFSIEVGQDWSGLQTEMAGLLQDAKDDLEATKFATGAGHGSLEPKGIITAATNTTTAGGVASFAVADLYKLFEALPPRFRPRAQFAANLFTIDKIRQFDTSGGSGVWMGPQGLQPAADAGAAGTVGLSVGVPLLGRNVWEATAMAAALTTGSKILLAGDFRYFVIVDRIGMSVEVLPLVVGTNHRPTGQRGLYAYWRNSSDALSAAAFQVLVTG